MFLLLRHRIVPATTNRNAHYRAGTRVVLDEFQYTCRDVLGLEDSAGLAQFLQALLTKPECHPRVDDLRADRVNADIRFLGQVGEDREKLATPAFAAA